MIQNDYYSVACNDLAFLQDIKDLHYYNQISVQCQQVAEKMLKSVAERVCVGIEKLMRGHNLRALYDEIHKNEPDFVLDRKQLSMLKDYYFDAKYPGDNFVEVTKDACEECMEAMYSVVFVVNQWREKNGYSCEDHSFLSCISSF